MKTLDIKKKRTINQIDGLLEKYEFELHDGEKIETVYRESRGKAEVYLSCQVGCGVGCQFCACSEEWLIRDMTWKEIVQQADAVLGGKKYHQLTISFNGIGEPTNNEKAVIKAVKSLRKKYPPARIKITTTGENTRVLKKFASLPVFLNLSLHAPTEELREQIIETTMNIPKIVKAARYFAKVRKQKVVVNYLLLKGFNDSFPIIDKLLGLLNPKYFRIRFFHLNRVAVRNFPYQESEKFEVLKEYVASKGFEVTEFEDVGRIANAGCGQLTSSK